MSSPFTVSGVRVTHDDAPLSTLEAASHDDWRERIDDLLSRDGVAEAAVLQTCNRVEEYVVTETQEAGHEALSSFPGVPDDAVVSMDHRESLRHLLRVAAGLDSQVLGEDQILGQVRTAYNAARERDALGPALDAGLLKAIHVGERARTETAINEGIVSLGSAAVQLADEALGLDGATVLVVGAGEMAETVVGALPDDALADVRFVNRSLDRAECLADEVSYPARCDGLDALPRHLRAADVVFSSTGSADPVITPDIDDVGETLFVDLAQPRDVAAGLDDRTGVTVRDLDALRDVTEVTHRDRREAAAAVEAIVDEEFDLLIDQYKRQRADAVISAMYRGADRIKGREVSRALSRLDDLNEEEREVVEDLADALVSQLLAVPTESLRDAAAEDDWETLSTALRLFNPHLDDAESAEAFVDAVSGADVPEGTLVDSGGED